MGRIESYISSMDFNETRVAYLVFKHEQNVIDLIIDTGEYVDAVMIANLCAQTVSKNAKIELLRIWGDKDGKRCISYRKISKKTLKRTIGTKKFKEKMIRLATKRG